MKQQLKYNSLQNIQKFSQNYSHTRITKIYFKNTSNLAFITTSKSYLKKK